MKLIVGLGNPGPEYAWTRHNAGWLVVDSYVTRLKLGEPRMKYRGAFWDPSLVEGERAAFLKPLTYMNLSGQSVVEAARYYNVEPCDILVVFDDVAIPFGKLRYRDSGSAGGQKGMISILAMLDTLDVPRLRIGIGAPRKGADMANWVLGKIPSDQRSEWNEVEELAWSAFMRWLKGEAGSGFTMQLASLTVKKDEPEEPK